MGEAEDVVRARRQREAEIKCRAEREELQNTLDHIVQLIPKVIAALKRHGYPETLNGVGITLDLQVGVDCSISTKVGWRVWSQVYPRADIHLLADGTFVYRGRNYPKKPFEPHTAVPALSLEQACGILRSLCKIVEYDEAHRTESFRGSPSPILAELRAEDHIAREKRAAKAQLRFRHGLRTTFAAIPLIVGIWMAILSMKAFDAMPKSTGKVNVPDQFYAAIACGIVGGIILAYAAWQNKRQEKAFKKHFPN